MLSTNGQQFTILNTRAKHQAASLTEAMMQVGGMAIELPCLEIVAVADQLHLQQQISLASQFDYIIFVSANAVYQTMPYWPERVSSKIIAQGPGTKAALEKYGIQPDWVPVHFNSQGILDLDIMQDVANNSIMILCGHRPKPLLADTLLARNARVEKIFCYERSQPALLKADFDQLDRASIHVVVVTSLEVLTNLCAYIQAFDQTWLYSKPLLVVSQTLLNYANSLPWRAQIIASQPSVADIVATLKAWQQV